MAVNLHTNCSSIFDDLTFVSSSLKDLLVLQDKTAAHGINKTIMQKHLQIISTFK